MLDVSYNIGQWSQREGIEGRKALRKDTVRGILMATLAVLAWHYGYER